MNNLIDEKIKKAIRLEVTAVQMIKEQIKDQFDKICIEGLRLKGFEFEYRQELEVFVSENCHSVNDSQTTNTTTFFYCYNEPFLKISWDLNPKIKILEHGDALKYSADFYKYEFL